MQIVPLTVENALVFLASHDRHYRSDAKPIFAIGISTEEKLCGAVIVGAAEGAELQLSHIYSAGESLGYTLLYGAAWRAAKALGYERMIL